MFSPVFFSPAPLYHHRATTISRPISTTHRTSLALRCAVHAPSMTMSTSISLTEDEAKFIEASRNGNLVPLYKCIFADHLTPLLAYRCLVKQEDWESPSFLFESVESAFQFPHVGRYSMVGSDPALEITAKENKVTIVDHEKGSVTKKVVDDPFEIPRSLSSGWTPQLLDGLPNTFCGGWAGCFSYDTIRYTEKKLSFSDAPHDQLNLPDIHIGLYQDVIVFDHVQKKAYAIHWVRLECYSSIQEAYNDGLKRLQRLAEKVQNVDLPRLSPGYVDLNTQIIGSPLKSVGMASQEYKVGVLKAKEHILAEEILQIELSQHFERRTYADPFEVYRSLSIVNPGPYMTYLQAKGCILVGSSPEIICRTKKVPGELLDHLTCWDTLRASLPAGPVTGVPKVKAMELIDKLEVTRRGPFSGGFGWISFTGEMDIALCLQTMVFPTDRFDAMYLYRNGDARKEWIAHIQTGAEIAADSVPEDEQQECEKKAAGLAHAIGLAESTFVGE